MRKVKKCYTIVIIWKQYYNIMIVNYATFEIIFAIPINHEAKKTLINKDFFVKITL